MALTYKFVSWLKVQNIGKEIKTFFSNKFLLGSEIGDGESLVLSRQSYQKQCKLGLECMLIAFYFDDFSILYMMFYNMLHPLTLN